MKSNMPVSSWKNPIHILAFGFGSGASPKAPGTAGTLMAVPLYLLLSGLDLLPYLALVVVVCLSGFYICGKTSADLKVHDHSGIVWDEFAGFFITMIAVPLAWWSVLLGFVLFRIFDIWKPWPIKALDKNVSGGFGIMIDDILAGIFAWLILFPTSYFLIEKVGL